MNFSTILETLGTDVLPYSFRIISALLILIIGLWFGRTLRKLINRTLNAQKVEPTISIFMGHLAYIVVLMLIVIMVLSRIGVQTTSLIAVLSAAVFAVALSLKDSFSSLAAGLLLIIFRPFQVGDYIQSKTSSGEPITGTVKEVQLLFTRLITDDNRSLYIPNESLTTSGLINVSHNKLRRQDLIVSIGHSDNIALAKSLLLEIASANHRVLNSPAPVSFVQNLTNDSINLTLRYWCRHEYFSEAQAAILEEIKLRFDSAQLSLSRPQQVQQV